MKFLKRWVIPLQIVFLLLQPFTLSSSITCSAGIATLGGEAKITCNFNRNIGSPKLNFVIWRFPLDTTDLVDSTYRTDVLRCNWEEEGSLNCRTAEGYKFNKQTVTTTAFIDIRSATADQEGIYKCLLVTQELIPTSPCNLTVNAREENQHIDNFISALTPTGAFILIVVVIVVCIIVSIAFIIYCWKYTCRRNRDQTVQTMIDTAEQVTDTWDMSTFIDRGVNTEDFPEQSSASNGKSSSWFSKKDEKKPLQNN